MRSIAIVGAGPAGAAAGYHLAVRQFAVTLIDRAAFPRDKVCGDWVPHTALRELARLGVDVAGLAGATSIHGSAVSSPAGVETTAPLGKPACCVRRRVLDAAVRERALAAGCVALHRDVRLGQDRDLDAFDLVIDARGAHAGAANAVGLRTYWHVPRAATTAQDRTWVRLCTDAAYRRGYGWIFPLDEDADSVRLNIGVGMLRADARRGHTVTDFLARFEASNPLLRRLGPVASVRERPVGYHVGLGGWRPNAGDGRVLRVGDAANLPEPLTGDGIPNALRSGYLLAVAIAGSRVAREAGVRWRHACAQHFGAELRRALVLRRLLQSTPAKNAAARLLASSCRARARLHATLFGEAPYRALLLPHG
jgi:flavin-dependent dehydrogenase